MESMLPLEKSPQGTRSTGKPSAPALPFLGLIPEDCAAGVRVASLVPDSPAARAGLRLGDVLVGFAGHLLTTVAEYTRLLATLRPDARYVVYLQRGKGTTFAAVTPTLKAR